MSAICLLIKSISVSDAVAFAKANGVIAFVGSRNPQSSDWNETTLFASDEFLPQVLAWFINANGEALPPYPMGTLLFYSEGSASQSIALADHKAETVQALLAMNRKLVGEI